jgi:hypothetical protein
MVLNAGNRKEFHPEIRFAAGFKENWKRNLALAYRQGAMHDRHS